MRSLSSLFSSCSIPSKRGLHHPLGALVSMCWHALLHACHSWPCSAKCRASDTLLLNIYIRFPLLFPILRNLRLDRGISQWHFTVQQSESERTNSSFGHITNCEIVFSFTMNSGQYHHRLQEHGLPMNYQYSEPPESLQSIHRTFAFDGLPRTQPDQNSMIPHPVSGPNLFHSNYSLSNQMSIPQALLPWGDLNQLPSHLDELDPNGYYEYSSNITGNSPDNSFLRRINFSETPRCMPDDIGLHHEHNMSLDDVYGQSSLYTANAPRKPGCQLLSSTRSSTGFIAVDNLRDPSQLSLSTSPRGDTERDVVDSGMLFDKVSPFRLPSSQASEDGGASSREMTAVEGEEPTSDEPYAKLIYRALMSKPNHSMVLQEIYQWFRENTVKGSSDTKGWMNSIRHNLSMNAV